MRRAIMKLFGCLLLTLTVMLNTAHAAPKKLDVAKYQKSLLRQAVERYQTSDKGTRIVGGSSASWANNKWQVALVYAKDSNNARAQFCGGSIVAPGWVITAAHCIDTSFDASDYAVLSGTDNLKVGGERSQVKKYIVHEKWKAPDNKSEYDNDIALLQIDTGVALKGEPISLVRPGTQLDALDVLVTGWGVTEFRPEGTQSLQQVTVPSVTEKTCNDDKAYGGAVTENMFCAGKHKKDACQGDSGGPATSIIQGKRLLIGIVSWGIGCGELNKYGVYTRLPLYIEWVAAKTNGEVK